MRLLFIIGAGLLLWYSLDTLVGLVLIFLAYALLVAALSD